MSFFLTLICIFFITDVLWWVSAFYRVKGWGLRLFVSVFALLQIGGLAIILGSRNIDPAWAESLPRPLISIVFIWHLLITLPWLLIFFSTSIVRGARALLIRSRTRSAASTEAGAGMSRREWLRSGVTLAPAILTGGAALWSEWQLDHFRVRGLDVPVHGLPPALEGLTLAHVTDIHVGHFTHGRVLEEIVRRTNDLNPDLVMLTGDLINTSLHDLPAAIDLVRGLRSRYGVFLCEGNHDLFDNAEKFRSDVRKAGLQFLWQETVKITVAGTPLQVLGSAWSHGEEDHRIAMEHLRTQRDPSAFPIVLTHHPHAFDSAAEFPLVLAGHTHGGQLMAADDVGFGPWMFRYWSGIYQREGRTLVVSNGTGNWFPVRVHAPAEILHLTLRRA